MDLHNLWQRVVAESTSRLSQFHGPSHWARVERNGIYLAEHVGADELVVRLFALLHDSRRISDSTDPPHGARAAEYARQIRSELPDLTDQQFAQLYFACQWHAQRRHADDLTVAVCWDADRLDLGRVGLVTDPNYLNTEPAKQIASTGDFSPLDEMPERSTAEFG